MTAESKSKSQKTNAIIGVVAAAVAGLCYTLYMHNVHPVGRAAKVDTKRQRILTWPEGKGAVTINIPTDPPEVSQCFDSSVRMLWLHQYEKALVNVERAVVLAKQHYGESSQGFAESLRMMAFVKVQLAYKKLAEATENGKTPSAAVLKAADGELLQASALMDQQYAIEVKADAGKIPELFADAREMGDFYLRIAKDDNQARTYFQQALMAAGSKNGDSQLNPREVLYVTATLAQLTQRQGNLAESDKLYSAAMAMAEKVLAPGDPIRDVIQKDRGLLAFKLKQPKECVQFLYPLIVAKDKSKLQETPDYKYVLFCGLIATQVVGDKEKHKQVAHKMLSYSEQAYGQKSPQYKFALIESQAADAGMKGALEPERAYKQALDELRHAESMESAALAQLGSPVAAEERVAPAQAPTKESVLAEETIPSKDASAAKSTVPAKEIVPTNETVPATQAVPAKEQAPALHYGQY